MKIKAIVHIRILCITLPLRKIPNFDVPLKNVILNGVSFDSCQARQEGLHDLDQIVSEDSGSRGRCENLHNTMERKRLIGIEYRISGQNRINF